MPDPNGHPSNPDDLSEKQRDAIARSLLERFGIDNQTRQILSMERELGEAVEMLIEGYGPEAKADALGRAFAQERVGQPAMARFWVAVYCEIDRELSERSSKHHRP